MNTSTVYTIQTDSLIDLSLNFNTLTENFKTIDTFIKNFAVFQRKFTDLQKMQKAANQQLSAFKIKTQNSISTMSQMLDSRGQISKGKSNVANQQINAVKQSIKQLKSFMTQNTRQEHQAQQVRQNQYQATIKKLNSQIKKLQEAHQNSHKKIQQLQKLQDQAKKQSATKYQISDIKVNIQEIIEKLVQADKKSEQIENILKNAKVEQFKQIIQDIDSKTSQQLKQMRIKFKLKSDYSDLIKLQEMLLNIISFSFDSCMKSSANKAETKKALIFLEKRINSLVTTFLGQQEGERQAILTAKQFKCISCSKDLGQMQGKLDKYKAWSVFPVKQSIAKDKYGGFGSGFQTIVQQKIIKKGGQVTFDEKGRMTAPFNLTSSVQGGSFLKASKSQHKIEKVSTSQGSRGLNISPDKKSLKYETNFMFQFGKSSQDQIDIKQEYLNQQKGLTNLIKFGLTQIQ